MADGKGCKCGAYGACECGCPDVDWTPQEVYDLRKRLSHLMDVAGKMAWHIQKFKDNMDALERYQKAHLTKGLSEAEQSWAEVSDAGMIDFNPLFLALAEWDGIKKEGV